MKSTFVSANAILLLAAVCAAQNQVAIPAHSAVYNGFTRGYTFTAQNNFIISQVELPLNAYQANDTAGFYLRVNAANTYFNVGGTSAVQSTSILVAPGDVVDVFGNWSPLAAGTFTAHNSYSASATNFATTIEGAATTLARNGVQNDIGNPGYVQGGNILGVTTGQIGRVWIYTNPPVGLYPNFIATPTSGPVGMTVNFTDTTFSSDPGGVLAWSWDLDGDSVIDSTAQNPSFVYGACGDYTVTLSVVDASNPAASITKNAYIHIGNATIAPNFTQVQIAPDTWQFTDTSSPAPASWAWDFDGDSIIDSTVQNPVWVYPTCTASANVTLTVTNTCSGPFSTTHALTLLPPMVASFTYASIAPGVFQFTDTSVPLPTSWAWDLDGDGITDSTAQNPVWAYTAPCTSVAVRLTAADNCANGNTTTRPILISPSTLTMSNIPNNGLSSANAGNLFDINVTNPNGITICGFDLYPFTASTAVTANFYVSDAAGGFATNYNIAANWRLVATGTGTSAGGYTASRPFALSNPIYLPQGQFSMAIGTSVGLAYTTLTANAVNTCPDFTVTAGRSAGPLFSAGIANRGFAGAIHYSTASNGGAAGYGFFGAGCPGPLGISSLTASGNAVLGTTLNVTVNNLPLNAAIMMTGFSKTSWALGALPFDLAVYGAPGCKLRVSPDANLLILGSGNSAVWPFNIPANNGLLGLNLYNQAVVLATGFNGAGAVGSDAAGMMIGL